VLIRQATSVRQISAFTKGGLFCQVATLNGQPTTLVSRLRLDAVLHASPGPQPKSKPGPKPKKGERVPSWLRCWSIPLPNGTSKKLTGMAGSNGWSSLWQGACFPQLTPRVGPAAVPSSAQLVRIYLWPFLSRCAWQREKRGAYVTAISHCVKLFLTVTAGMPANRVVRRAPL
jgi:hypothetical protein